MKEENCTHKTIVADGGILKSETWSKMPFPTSLDTEKNNVHHNGLIFIILLYIIFKHIYCNKWTFKPCEKSEILWSRFSVFEDP